jgi:hypothetical protein
MSEPRIDLREAPGPEECLDLDSFSALFGERLVALMDRPARTLGCTPREAWRADPTELDIVAAPLLSLTLLRRGKILVVGREGLLAFRGEKYLEPALARFHGMKVEVGWKERSDQGPPPELAVFLIHEAGRRLKRQRDAEVTERVRAAAERAATAGPRLAAARRPSGPLIDPRGGVELEDFLCIAVRADLVGPDLVARLEAGRERRIQTVQDAERAGDLMRRAQVSPATPGRAAARGRPARRTGAPACQRHRRAGVERERRRGGVGS